MSRIGNKEILILENVTVKADPVRSANGASGQVLNVTGENGSLSVQVRPEIQISISDGKILLTRVNETKLAKSLHGLSRTLVANAIEGVSKGFKKNLEIIGVGFRAEVANNILQLKIGFSHPVEVKPREGISFEVKKNIISVIGIDKQLVGQTAAEIRNLKKPEPYKGKGIKYVGEKIIRKVGKAVKSAGTGA